MSLVTTPAVLLRSHPYSETSQILRFYSETHGVVGAVARGVRKAGGRRGAPLSTFSLGSLTVHFREGRDLQTFKDFSPTDPRRALASHPVRLAGASVLGELILRHAEGETQPILFSSLNRGLDSVAALPLESLLQGLLMEVWALVEELGFAPVVQGCVDCGNPFREEDLARFDFGAGGLRCPSCQSGPQGPRIGPQARSQLQSLLDRSLQEDLLRPRAHLRLASDFITYHISGGTPLRSMRILADLISKAHA